jgi:threonine dehydratase
MPVGAGDIAAAAARIAPYIRRTPVLTDPRIDRRVGARVHFKCEHLQHCGVFKARGATNAVFALDDATAARGVAAHSSGNHAAALAWAAQLRGIACRVVMPERAAPIKVASVRSHGATIEFCAPTLAVRESALAAVLACTGAVEIHPYDNRDVIAGQGTAAQELLQEVPEVRAVIAPVGGGGLLAGTAIASHAVETEIAVIGGEPRNVDDAYRSLAAGRRVTDGNGSSIADGLLTTLSDRTFTILRDHAVEIVTVTEEEILAAMALVSEELQQAIEPSTAVAVAALLAWARSGRPLPDDVGVILSGGNVDPALRAGPRVQ